jgi:hypothetical protein
MDEMPFPQWGPMWTELYGYVSEAAADGQPLDAAQLEQYMRELKNQYVTAPVRAWLRSVPRVTDGG